MKLYIPIIWMGINLILTVLWFYNFVFQINNGFTNNYGNLLLAFGGAIILISVLNWEYFLEKADAYNISFRCCFEGCCYKNESLFNIFRHMEDSHKLKIEKIAKRVQNE